MAVGGNFTSCNCGSGAAECQSPTEPVATVGLCLADGSPIAVTVVRDCAGTVTAEGWIDLATGTWSAGAPPAGTIACGDSRSITTNGTFCDVAPDTGDVLGLVLVEYQYAPDGSIAAVRLVDAVTGQTYTPQGEVTTCPAGVEQPERDMLQLCDLTDAESGADPMPVPFLRDYQRDENGQITGHSDYTLDGTPYVPTGTVGVCPAESTCRDCTTHILCDTGPEPAQVGPNAQAGTLPNGVEYTITGATSLLGQPWFPLRDQTETWTFSEPVRAKWGVQIRRTGDCLVLPEGAVPVTVAAAHTYDPATRTLCTTAPSNDLSVSTFTHPGAAELVFTAGAGQTPYISRVVGLMAAGPVSQQFQRTTCRDCHGQVIDVTDTLLDGTTPYTPTGTVGVCHPPVEEPCASTVSTLRLCDLNPDAAPDENGRRCAVPFLRHLVHSCDGALTETRDTAIDGTTPYTPVQVVDCGSGGVPALNELLWPQTGIAEDPAGAARQDYIYTITNPQTEDVAEVRLHASSTAPGGCGAYDPAHPVFNNPTTYTLTLDAAAQEMSTFRLDLLDFDVFEGVTGLNPVPSRVEGDVTWSGTTIRANASNITAYVYWDNPPATISYRYGNTGGGLACSSVAFQGMTLVPDGCCACDGAQEPCRDTSSTLLCDTAATELITVFDPATRPNADGWDVVSFTGANPGAGPEAAMPYPARYGTPMGYPALGARADQNAGSTGSQWPGYDFAPVRWVLRKVFEAPEDGVAVAQSIGFRADGGARVRINGTDAGMYGQWNQPATSGTASIPVTAGPNVVEIEVRDTNGINNVSGRLDLALPKTVQFMRRTVVDCETGATVSVTDTTLDGEPYTVVGEVGQCEPVAECCEQPPPETRVDVETQLLCVRDQASGDITGQVIAERVYDDQTGDLVEQRLTDLAGDAFTLPAGAELVKCPSPDRITRQVCVVESGRSEMLTNAANATSGQDTDWQWAPNLSGVWHPMYRVAPNGLWTATDTAPNKAHWVGPHSNRTVCPAAGENSPPVPGTWYTRASWNLPANVEPETIRIAATVLNADNKAVQWRLNDGAWQPGGGTFANPAWTFPPTAVPGGRAGQNEVVVQILETQPAASCPSPNEAGMMLHVIATYDHEPQVWTQVIEPGGQTYYLDENGDRQNSIPAGKRLVACGGGGDAPCCPAVNTDTVTLCDTAPDSTVTEFLRHLTYTEGADAPTVVDTGLDGVTPYTPAGTVGTCSAPPEPCRDTSTLLLCDLPTDGTPGPTVTDTAPAPYYPYPTGLPMTGAQALWDGGALTVPAGTGPQPGTTGTVRTLAATIQAARPACDTGTAHVTVSVDANQLGPDAGCAITGAVRLFNGTTPVATVLPPNEAAVGWSGTLTVKADVPATDLAAGNIVFFAALDTYDDSPQVCPGSPRETSWELSGFTASVAYEQTGCATQILRTVTVDCETGAVLTVTDTTLGGDPYTVTGEVGECTTGGDCCPTEECRDTSTLLLCDSVGGLPALDPAAVSVRAAAPPVAAMTAKYPNHRWQDAAATAVQTVVDGGAASWGTTDGLDNTSRPDWFVWGGFGFALAGSPQCGTWDDAGDVVVTMRVKVINNGPRQGVDADGVFALFNGTTWIGAKDVQNALPVGASSTLTFDPFTVAVADLPDVVAVLALELKQGAGTEKTWTVQEFTYSVAPVPDSGTAVPGCEQTQFLRTLVTDCTGEIVSTSDTTLDGQPYEVAGEVGQCTPASGGTTQPEPCQATSVLEACRCDDTDGDGVADTDYVELLGVDCDGQLTSIGTYTADLSAPYAPVAPVECESAGADPATGVQAHRVELAAGKAWAASAWPTLQSVTAVARGTGTVTTEDGVSTLVAGESVSWSVARDVDALLTGPLAVTADTGTVVVSFTTGVTL